MGWIVGFVSHCFRKFYVEFSFWRGQVNRNNIYGILVFEALKCPLDVGLSFLHVSPWFHAMSYVLSS